MDYVENPGAYDGRNSIEYDNMRTMIDELKGIEKEFSEFRKDYNNFVSSSPFKIILESNDNKFIDNDDRIKVSVDWKNANLDRSKLNDVLTKSAKLVSDSNKDVSKSNKDVVRSNRDLEKELRNSGNKLASTGKSLLSGMVKGIAGLLGTAALSAFRSLPQRAVNEYKDMVSARNDLMYQYGLPNTKAGIAEADRLYKLRFEHKALPWQRRTAPQQREFEREQRKTAIDMGFNTEEQVKIVTQQMTKWNDIFDDINLASSRLFQNTIRFIDRTGKTTDTLFTKIREVSQNYIVTPDLLESVAAGYSKYLRVITKSNKEYTKSMTGLMETVGKLENAGVDSRSIIDPIKNFRYNDISNAASSSMWTRLSVLGLDPYKILTMNDPNEATKMYADALKNKFKGLDVSKGTDRLYINTIAQQQLGYSAGEMQNLYDLLADKTDEDQAKNENIKKIDDHTAKIAIDMESYYDQATAGWTYVSAIQKAQDELSLKILNNEKFQKFFEEWNDKTALLQAITGGFGDLGKAIDAVQSFLLGGAAYSAGKTLFSTIKGAIIGSKAAGGAIEGAAAIGGALGKGGGLAGGAAGGAGLGGTLALGTGAIAAIAATVFGAYKKDEAIESGKTISLIDEYTGEKIKYNKYGDYSADEYESAIDVDSIVDDWKKATGYSEWEYLNKKKEDEASPHSHAGGLDWVPYDNYSANLHKGERVLTASESRMMDMVMNQSTGIFGDSSIMDDFTSIFTKEGGSDNMFSGVEELTEDVKVQNKNSEGLLKSFDPSNKLGMLFNIMGLDTTNKEGNKLTSDNSKKISDNTISVDGLKGKMKDLTGGITDLIKEIKELAKLKLGKYTGKLSGNTLASIADKVINGQEGTYNSINPRDNGALSIGKVQWHAGRAQNLLKDIYEASPEEFKSIADKYGAGNLISSIKNDDWSGKILSEGSSEYNAIKEILSTDISKKIQDELSQKDITDYIDVGKSYGLKDPAALIYFADFANQYGQGSSLLKRITIEALSNGGTLDAMYEATRNNTGEYLSRRKSVYDEIKSMNFSELITDPKRQAIVDAAKSTIGMKYGLGYEVIDSNDKSNPEVDCSGLVWYAYHMAGLDNIVGSDRDTSPIGTADTMYEASDKISFDELLPGDLVFLNNAGHVGIYAGDNKVIQASSGRGRVVEDPLNNAWEKAGRLLKYKIGGEITEPTLAVMGEGGYKEYVISTDPKFNDRSVDLLGKAASDIGVASLSNTAANVAPQVTEVYVDTDGIINAVEELTDIVKRGFEALGRKEEVNIPPSITTNNNSIMNYV